jgi:hypothetical protein
VIYRLAADAVLFVHLGFILFVVLGGLVAFRWTPIIYLHLPAVIWGTLIEFRGWICPLTPLEQHLLRAAGDAGYTGSFIERYLLPLIYPSNLTPTIQVVLGMLVVAVNLAVYTGLWYRYLHRGAQR